MVETLDRVQPETVQESSNPINVVCLSNEYADQLRFDLVNQGLNAKIDLVEGKPRLVTVG